MSMASQRRNFILVFTKQGGGKEQEGGGKEKKEEKEKVSPSNIRECQYGPTRRRGIRQKRSSEQHATAGVKN